MDTKKRLYFEDLIVGFPGKMFRILIAIIVILVMMGLFVDLYQYYFLDYAKNIFHRDFNTVVELFDLNNEANIPTWFSSFDLLAASFFLACIALIKDKQKDSYTFYWKEISFIFLLLSIDEISCIHEMFNFHFLKFGSCNGAFHFPWVIFGSIFVLFFVILNLRFLFHLDPETRNLFILSGAIYISGALGLEMAAGEWISLHGSSITSAIFSIVEEFCEMTGIALFNFTLFSYFVSYMRKPEVTDNYTSITTSLNVDEEITVNTPL